MGQEHTCTKIGPIFWCNLLILFIWRFPLLDKMMTTKPGRGWVMLMYKGVALLPTTVTSTKVDQQKSQKCSRQSLWHSQNYINEQKAKTNIFWQSLQLMVQLIRIFWVGLIVWMVGLVEYMFHFLPASHPNDNGMAIEPGTTMICPCLKKLTKGWLPDGPSLSYH